MFKIIFLYNLYILKVIYVVLFPNLMCYNTVKLYIEFEKKIIIFTDSY